MIQKSLVLIVAMSVSSSALAAPQTVYPARDGTLADGGVYGPFDGVADDADWYFNQSSYEGSISLAHSTPQSSLEHRVVWEYNLSSVTHVPPVSATLYVWLRGAPVFPRPNAPVHVYAYPADLVESLGDFDSAPLGLVGVVSVPPFQPSTLYTLDVSSAVSAAMSSGGDRVAFRFQIDPATPNAADQAFIDALDSDVTTKPYLRIDEGPPVPGDLDGDGDVDLDDYAECPPCLLGPGIAPSMACEPCDFDSDADVDLGDFQLFQAWFSGG